MTGVQTCALPIWSADPYNSGAIRCLPDVETRMTAAPLGKRLSPLNSAAGSYCGALVYTNGPIGGSAARTAPQTAARIAAEMDKITRKMQFKAIGP